MDDGRLDDLMGELETSPRFFFIFVAGRKAADMVGAEVLASVHDAEIIVAKYPVLFEMLAPLQETEEGREEAFEFPGVDLVHDGPHLRVRRDGFDTPTGS